jgi:hypothetical protein
MKKVTEKQLNANRENSKLGGVKTDEGKEISRFNAVKHGILKKSISEYEEFDFLTLYNSLSQDFHPQNTLEEILVERISIAYIKLLRVAKAEAELMKTAIDPTIVSKLLEFETYEEKEGYKPVVTTSHMEYLSSYYTRYETSIENRMYKAINKLLELRKNG